MRNGDRKTCPGAVKLARHARSQPSVAEQVMWTHLRDWKTGFKFRREALVRSFRVDFYCPAAKLVVELDGEQHDPVADAVRDAEIAKAGILVYRIPNVSFFGLVGSQFDFIAEIVRLCKERSAP